MSFEYGILTIGTLSTSTSNYEAGYVFTANKTLKFHGFRVYPYATTSNITCRLWDAETKTQIASLPIASTTTKTWNEVYLDAPIKLEKGKSYAISYYSSPTRYRQTIETAEFNPLISVVSGCYSSSSGAYPATADTTYTHQLIDCIITNAYSGKYLIREGTALYTVTDGALTALTETEITASLFQTYGVDEAPDGSLLVGLTDPEVLYWFDSTEDEPVITVAMTATPYPQNLYTPDYDMTHPSILGIETVVVDASEDVLFAFSFDGGVTWKAHNGTAWATLTEDNSGMVASTIAAISVEDWAAVATTGTFRVRAILNTTDSYLGSFVVDYLNE